MDWMENSGRVIAVIVVMTYVGSFAVGMGSIPDLQGPHDACGWHPAQFERTSQTQKIVPVLFNSIKRDTLPCNYVEFSVVRICINPPEALATNIG